MVGYVINTRAGWNNDNHDILWPSNHYPVHEIYTVNFQIFNQEQNRTQGVNAQVCFHWTLHVPVVPASTPS